MKQNITIHASVRWLVVALVISATAFLSADDEPLTLEQSIDLALAQNRTLQSAANGVISARRSVDQSWSELLPSFSASLSASRSNTLWTDRQEEGSTQIAAGVNASLPIQPGLRSAIRRTQHELDSAEISYEQARLELINAVERQFLYLIAYRGTVELEELNLELARERYQSVEARYQRGQASELDLLEANVTVASQEPAVMSARNQYETLLRSFLNLLGIDPEAAVALDGALEVEEAQVDEQALANAYVWSRLDVQAQQAAIATVDNTLRLTRSNGRYPTLSLTAGWSGSVTNPVENWEAGRRDSLSVGLNISIPIDSWLAASDTGQAIAAAEDQLADARLVLGEKVDDARIEILNAVSQLETLWSQIEMGQASVERAQRAYEMTEEAYQRGTRSLLDVEDAQQSYLAALQSVLMNRYNYRSALIDLRAALGLESLDEITA